MHTSRAAALVFGLVVVPAASASAPPPQLATYPVDSAPDSAPDSARNENAETAPLAPRPYFVSTSLFMLGNLLPEPPSFFQANLGYRRTPTQTFIVEAITWTYPAPLGIPIGPDFGDPQYNYPGHTRSVGVGLAYQHYWWRGLYSTVHATPFLQTYYDDGGTKLGHGFQLFAVFRTGYHFDLLDGRLFLEPSVAATSWPIDVGQPAGFAAAEEGWPRYLLFEPGFHLGFSF